MLLTALGILRYRDDLDRVIFSPEYIYLVVADVACILALLVLGQTVLAVAYFILAPFSAHAIANAFYYGEEKK